MNSTTYTYTKAYENISSSQALPQALPETFAAFYAGNSRFKKFQLSLSPALREECEVAYNAIRCFVLRFQNMAKAYASEGWKLFVPAPIDLSKILGEGLQVPDLKTLRGAKKVLTTISGNLPDFSEVKKAFCVAKEAAQLAWLKDINGLLGTMPRMLGYAPCNQATLFLKTEGRNIWTIESSDHRIENIEWSLKYVQDHDFTPANTVVGFYNRSF